MKSLFLLSLFCLSIGFSHAQNFYPNVISPPETGMEQLRNDNPYFLLFDPDSTGNGWKPASRYIRTKAPNAPYTGLDIISSWDTAAWDDNQQTRDSFVLDDQNRLHMAFVQSSYSYPGFSGISKEKYIFTYDTQSRFSKIEYFMTQPDTSNNYVRQSMTYVIYDQDGKRVRDSILYYYSGVQRYKTHYLYNDNKLMETIQFNSAGDTTGKSVYTYSGDLVTSASNLGFDASSDEWTLNYTDTFGYNTQNQVNRRVSAGYVYIDGNLYFQPYRNENYEYTNDNQLKTFISSYWYEDEWYENTKTEISYGTNGKAQEGYQYQYVNGTWSSTPMMKYLFSYQTGIQTITRMKPEPSVFPNPASDKITVHSGQSSAFVRVLDLSGKRIFEGNIRNNESMDVSQWQNGLYYMLVTAGEKQYTRKVLVEH